MLTRSAGSRRAFTLLELIVVLVVLGLLAAIAIPTYQAVIGNAEEAGEVSSLEAVGRDALALAAFDQVSPPSPAHWQAAFDETPGYGAFSEGLSAVASVEVAVVVGDDPAPPGADKVFRYDVDGDTSALIAPSTSKDDRCAVVSTAGSTVSAAIVDASEFGADSGDPIDEQCSSTVALNWALDADAPVPPATTTSTTTTSTTTTVAPYPAGSPSAPVLVNSGSYSFAQQFGEFSAPVTPGDSPVEDYTVRVVGPSIDLSCTLPAADWPGWDISTFGFYCGSQFVSMGPHVITSGVQHTTTITARNAQGSGAPLTITWTPT